MSNQKRSKKKQGGILAPLMSRKEPKYVKAMIAWTAIIVEIVIAILIGVVAFASAGNV